MAQWCRCSLQRWYSPQRTTQHADSTHLTSFSCGGTSWSDLMQPFSHCCSTGWRCLLVFHKCVFIAVDSLGGVSKVNYEEDKTYSTGLFLGTFYYTGETFKTLLIIFKIKLMMRYTNYLIHCYIVSNLIILNFDKNSYFKQFQIFF